ncbi:hypothetical protein [Ramlibacter sp.]|uniref:hypothetical protein n=1 Tax=Ramlibacter sp. TaxID=1917967 RepID=UPI002625B9E9|nr:hypothetical protein [Ramlibacter sp.]MDB5957519.1 hypothetical protein [Ramlibacter sp.]
MSTRPLPPKVGNAVAELNRRRLNDLQSRQRATTILTPEAMQGGKHSPARLLWTTLRGEARPITQADLVAFRKSVAAVGGKLQAGITAQEVIDLSTPADRERARREIPHAIPARLRAGEVVFSVSAGPESRVNRHMVTILFPGYGAALSRPGTALQAAAWLGQQGHLKLDCDCERHRYFYRFLSSIGGFNAGRAEPGFPKIRNPHLRGLCCKHVVRVASELKSGMFTRRQIAGMIEADRQRLEAPRRVKPQVILVRQQQAAQGVTVKPRAIRTTDDAHRSAVLAGVRRALATRGAGDARADVAATLSALQARTDVSAGAILQALQRVLQQPAGS